MIEICLVEELKSNCQTQNSLGFMSYSLITLSLILGYNNERILVEQENGLVNEYDYMPPTITVNKPNKPISC